MCFLLITTRVTLAGTWTSAAQLNSSRLQMILRLLVFKVTDHFSVVNSLTTWKGSSKKDQSLWSISHFESIKGRLSKQQKPFRPFHCLLWSYLSRSLLLNRLSSETLSVFSSGLDQPVCYIPTEQILFFPPLKCQNSGQQIVWACSR